MSELAYSMTQELTKIPLKEALFLGLTVEYSRAEYKRKKLENQRKMQDRAKEAEGLTSQQQKDCDRLMRLHNNDIKKVAMELWVSPDLIQVYLKGK